MESPADSPKLSMRLCTGTSTSGVLPLLLLGFLQGCLQSLENNRYAILVTYSGISPLNLIAHEDSHIHTGSLNSSCRDEAAKLQPLICPRLL